MSSPNNSGKVVVQMLGCALGIYVSFFSWSLLQERIATQTYLVDGVQRKFKYFFVLNGIQALECVVLSTLILIFTRQFNPSGFFSRKFPFGTTAMIGLSNTLASPCGYAAMTTLSYPLVTTVKMSKMVPILMVGVVWHRARYSIEKYLACAIITLGVVGFALFSPNLKSGGDNSATMIGFVLVLINLVLDGYTNSTQDILIKRHNMRGSHAMLTTNAACFIGNFIMLFALEHIDPSLLHSLMPKPEFYAAMNFFTEQPEALRDVLLMGGLGATGQFFIFQTIALFGSLTVTAMTLTRKMGTVLISVIIHDHKLAREQWVALVLTFIGLALEAVHNTKSATKRADDEHARTVHHQHPQPHHQHQHKPQRPKRQNQQQRSGKKD